MAKTLDPFERIQEREATVGWGGLTEAEQNYYAIWVFEAELNNGGLQQFFDSAPLEWVQATTRGLYAVGAARMGALLAAAVSLLGGIRDDEGSARSARLTVSPETEPQIDLISSELSDYPDDLRALVARYVADQSTSFLGPRTPLELWESRRARGASTKPRFITESMRHSTRETDRAMSTRSCPNCGYPSPDFRESCRDCGYPHGRA
jgi:hypothetical protein